jgi:hypothetical protein
MNYVASKFSAKLLSDANFKPFHVIIMVTKLDLIPFSVVNFVPKCDFEIH